MSTRIFDWIIVGAGGAGCATTYFLNRDGRSTLTIDRYRLNHAFGSSHGRSRILRTAYSEGAHYVPLVLRSRLLWKRLAKEVAQEIFRPTGVVLVGRRDASRIRGALKSAALHGLPHQILSPEATLARFPAFRLGLEEVAVWDPGGGVLFPERALTSFVRRAAANGARFVWNAPVTDWEVGTEGLVRVTARGAEFRARGLILTAGAWLPSLVPELRLPLEIEQQTVFWFRYAAARATAFQNMPAFVWQREGEGYFYGIPDVGDGVKVAADAGEPIRDLDHRSRRPSATELSRVRGFAREHLPGLSARPRQRITCLYTNTPDHHFLIDVHPDHSNVILATACSGHGFKFMTGIGEQVARMARNGGRVPALEAFGLDRFRT
jgi:sarcosine oxidase